MFESSNEVDSRSERIRELLLKVCEDEAPWFVSDSATLYDVCSLSGDEMLERIARVSGAVLSPSDLDLPIWQLLDRIGAKTEIE